MNAPEPPAVWWSPSLSARSGHAAAILYRDVHGLHDSDGVPVEDNLPADAVPLVPDTYSHQTRILAAGAAAIERKAWRRGYDEARAEFEQPAAAVRGHRTSQEEDNVSDHPTMSELKDYKPRWTAEGVDYEADWNIRPDGLTIGADRLRDSAINAAWVQMRNHLPHEHWSTEACDAIVEATLRTVRDWVEAP